MSNHRDQAEFWKTQTSWATHCAALDATMAPALDIVLARAGLQTDQNVLDIGCGTGASLLAAAEAVGPNGQVCGVDISPPLLEIAGKRCASLPQIRLVECNAETEVLPSGFDAMISRFGVMFFSNPQKAFANIANSLTCAAPLTMIAWGVAGQNPWFMLPARIARNHLGEIPKIDRSLPGPFAFENMDRVYRDLQAAGLKDVYVDQVTCELTPQGSAADIADLSTHIGPAASALRQLDGSEADRLAIRDSLEEEFASFATPNGLRVPACLNLITARKA